MTPRQADPILLAARDALAELQLPTIAAYIRAGGWDDRQKKMLPALASVRAGVRLAADLAELRDPPDRDLVRLLRSLSELPE